jgi:hypothetical protein
MNIHSRAASGPSLVLQILGEHINDDTYMENLFHCHLKLALVFYSKSS